MLDIRQPKYQWGQPVIAVTDLNLQSDLVGKGVSQVILKAGDITWAAGGFTHTLMNVSRGPAKFITLEFH